MVHAQRLFCAVVLEAALFGIGTCYMSDAEIVFAIFISRKQAETGQNLSKFLIF